MRTGCSRWSRADPAPSNPGGDLAEVATAVLRPAPLDADAVRQLARLLRSWELSQAAAERLVARTGGLALLLVAVLRGATDPSQLAAGTDVAVTVRAAASRLLTSVPPPARRLVEASAVLAEPVDLVALGRIAGVEDSGAGVTAAVSAGLLRLGPSDVVDCAHALLRDAVYLALPVGRRRELHARAAAWTTGDRRLAHRASGADRPDPALATELTGAADLARASRHYDLAANQRLRARSVSDDPLERDRLLLEALVDRVSSEDLAGAAPLAELAQPLAPSALRSLALGLLDRESGRIGEALTLLGDALTRARSGSDEVLTVRAGMAAAGLYVRVNENAAAIEAIGDADQSSDPELAGDALTLKGIGLWQAGDPSSALTLLRRARLSRDGTAWEADLLAVRAAVHLYAGQLPEALSDLDRSIGLAHLWRPSPNQSRIYTMRSNTRFWLGDWDGAAVDAAAARALAEGGFAAWALPLAQAASADVPTGRGQWIGAAEHLEAATAALQAMPWIQSTDSVAARQAGLLLARRDDVAVLRLVGPLRAEEHLAQLAPFRSYRWVLPAWIRACLGLGRHADAERSLADYQVLLERWPGGPTPSLLGWLRGLLAEARGELRLARQHYADDLHDPAVRQTPFEHGQVLLAAGRLDRALDDRRGALGHLDQARSIFAELRAQPSLERCLAELAAYGRRPAAASPSSLTEREEDVAALVSRGYTNKEVGAELFLTAKTVEYHLSKIYAKLGVTNRWELRRERAVPRSVGG